MRSVLVGDRQVSCAVRSVADPGFPNGGGKDEAPQAPRSSRRRREDRGAEGAEGGGVRKFFDFSSEKE